MSNSILDKFYKDGYVILEDFLRPEEVDELLAAGRNLTDLIPEPKDRVAFSSATTPQSRSRYFLQSADKVRPFFEENSIGPNGELLVDKSLALNKVGHALHIHVPAFRKYTLEDERVKEVCWQLGLADPVVVQSMYIYKNPKNGAAVTPHQDAAYLHTEPVNLVGFWYALDDATVENGCLWVAPGSHKSGVHRRYIRNPDPNSEELLIYTTPLSVYQQNSFTPVPVKRGTCILIHGQIVHYSEPNKSDKQRNAYTFHVAEQRNTKYSENNWLQPTPEQPFVRLYDKNH